MAQKEATLWLKIKSAGEDVLDNIIGKLTSLEFYVKLAAGAFAAFSAIIVKSIAEYKEKEVAIKQLTTAMVNNGIYSAELSKRYEEQANALSKVSLFEDNAITKAQALMQSQLGQIEISDKLMKATMDLAQAQGIDLASAAEMVSKSLVGTRNSLGQYGITLSEGVSTTKRMEEAIAGLNSKFGGQAESATEGLGSIGMLTKSMNELYEKIGEKVAPSLVIVIKHFKEFIDNSPMVVSSIDWIADAFDGLIITTQTVAGYVKSSGNVIYDHFATLGRSAKELLTGNIGKAKDEFIKGHQDIMKEAQKAEEDITKKNNDILLARDNAEAVANEKKKKNQEASSDNYFVKLEEDMAKEDLLDAEKSIREMNRQMESIGTFENSERLRLQVKIKSLDDQLKVEQDAIKKNELMQEKARATKDLLDKTQYERDVANRKDALTTISSLQSSSNKNLAAIGKAAAITNIMIQAPQAFMNALAVPPYPLGVALAAGVAITTADQIARVAGVQLAEGGIVMPRPGGIQATIGEGGQAEAVIPLDRAGEFGMGGGGVTINVYGGLLGDQSSARQFAVAIDRELYNLRKNNESVSFEGIVI